MIFATHPLRRAYGACALLLLAAAPASAQVALNALDTAYTQNFNALPASGSSAWSNNTTLAGWYHARTGSGGSIVADTGAGNAGNLYSYGAAGANERALGSVGSGNAAVGDIYYGLRLRNATGSTITSLDVAYTVEQWRNSGAAAQTATFSYLIAPAVTGSLTEFQSSGTAVTSLDMTSPVSGGAAAALNGNLAANRVARNFTLSGISLPDGSEIMLRWADPDHGGADHGLAMDDLSVTPHGSGPQPLSLSIADAGRAEGNSGTSVLSFTVNLNQPAPAGGVTFDIATSNGAATAGSDYVASALTAQTIAAGSSSYTFDVVINGDTDAEPDETFLVSVGNVVNALVADGQATGTIINDDALPLAKIHDVQGNGAATTIGSNVEVSVEGIVTASYQGAGKLSGFFLQEEDADADADPNTSEGIFIYCGACPTPVGEGQRVRATGLVSEFFGLTEISASTAAAVVVTDAGNNLGAITPATVALPVAGDLNAYYEARESMLVRFSDSLFVAEYFELARYGQIELYQGARPRQFTEDNAPSASGNAAHLQALARRRVLLDDENNVENWPLTLPEGAQYFFHPQANGGFSAGVHGTDFFRGGDRVDNLTGVLHWSFNGTSGSDAWRIRPTRSTPVAFTPVNVRPAQAPVVGGAIKAAGVNVLNYFTTLDTTSSSNSGPCGPSGGQDCRGADSAAELDRQRERTAIVLCGLDADVFGLVEIENGATAAAINDLLGAVNARCGGAQPYVAVNTGGALGTDAIRVLLIYRSGVLAPVGSALTDMNSIHNRPPTAQTFDVVDAANPARGQRFTVIASHFKSKGCGSASGGDSDSGDGQACYAARRTQQAARLLSWIDATVIPAANDPDVLLLGDYNAYAKETPITTLTGAGYVDLLAALGGAQAYSYLFDGQLGHLDYALASASLAGQIVGIAPWHINADELPQFDYNDDVKDTGEPAYQEEPNGSALKPPRSLVLDAAPYRASDHDPVLVGLFGGDILFQDGFEE
ncbi:ExeM/NucH family extracellular endonuclease [Tahibacter harae]|uniref:ExeM/NucH family extracellular endonuclease n=1 Tax=Tahibacter harae TaxID=2963937 RepID=A0ABT1QPG7_9GAMM|nr:ExeM/NucH family extracellular endonuclease [Tahibacter harae]MCQ4164182.1 ExeM/NucH family extracellular endonuclease [Tahibacter harae]